MTTINWPAFDVVSTPEASGRLAIDTHWSGFGGAHGGLLVAAAARAMGALVSNDNHVLRSIHMDFLSGVQPGELQLDARLEKAGRMASFAAVSGNQDGKPRVRASAVFGAPGPADRPEYTYIDPAVGTAPDVPDPADCPTWEPSGGAMRTVLFKPASSNLPLRGGLPDFSVWLGIVGDDRPSDPYRLLTLSDAPAPGLFGRVLEPFPIPTVEFTAQVMPAAWAPVGRWVLARMRTVVAEQGYAVDDCELWDEDRRLLLTSRQTRLALA